MSDETKLPPPPAAAPHCIDPTRATGFNLVGDGHGVVLVFNRQVFQPGADNKMVPAFVFGPGVAVPWPLFDTLLKTMNEVAAARAIEQAGPGTPAVN